MQLLFFPLFFSISSDFRRIRLLFALIISEECEDRMLFWLNFLNKRKKTAHDFGGLG